MNIGILEEIIAKYYSDLTQTINSKFEKLITDTKLYKNMKKTTPKHN